MLVYPVELVRVHIMASLFNKDPEKNAPLDPYARERIEKEIDHLNRNKSVRDGGKKEPTHRGAAFLVLVVIGILGALFPGPPFSTRFIEARPFAFIYTCISTAAIRRRGSFLTPRFLPRLTSKRWTKDRDHFTTTMPAPGRAQRPPIRSSSTCRRFRTCKRVNMTNWGR